MAWLSLYEIAEMVQGAINGADIPIEGISIDSRTTKPGDLFVAIKGERFNGHDFVKTAAASGAAALMVSQAVTSPLAQIRVPDTLQALSELAAQWCRRLNITILALTGSNGKTTTKEIIASILRRCRQVVATPGNFNNHIGVPLTVLSIREQHDAAVVEMGANHHGDIRNLCDIVKPDIALLLNASAAHIEGFGSLDGVAEAKGEIFESLSESGTAILNKDDAYYRYWLQRIKKQRVVEFSLSTKADFHLLSHQGQTVELSLAGKPRTCRMQLLGRHNISNVLAAAAASYVAGAGIDDIVAGIESVSPVPGRLVARNGMNGCRLIDDSYNANPASLEVALAVLKQIPGEHWLALGTMAELGDESVNLHARAGKQAKSMDVHRLFAIGDDARIAAENFGEEGESFGSIAALIPQLKAQLKPGVSLLVKGSRSARMDQLVAALLPTDKTVS